MSNREYYGNDYLGNTSAQTNSLQQHGAMENSNTSFSQDSDTPFIEEKQGIAQTQNNWGEAFNPNATMKTQEGERGLGATVIGGAGGAMVGHHVGKKSDHGTLGAVGGALAGAVLANMAGHAVERHHGHRGAGGRRRERLERRLDRLS